MSHSMRERSPLSSNQARHSASRSPKSCAVSMRNTRHAASPRTLRLRKRSDERFDALFVAENCQRAHGEQTRALVGVRCERQRAERLLEPVDAFLLVEGLERVERTTRDALVVVEQGRGQRLDEKRVRQLGGDQVA